MRGPTSARLALRGMMRGLPVLIALAWLAPLESAVAKPAPGVLFRGVPKAVLIAAAKAAPLKLIDDEAYCDSDTLVAAWLKQLTAPETRRIAWTAGRCELVNRINPLDAGGSYCVQATLTLKHPKNHRDAPEIEIYLEDPKHGKPGAAYAFRAMFDSVDGPDYIRFRRDFESEWGARFKDTPPGPCDDGQ
jgi:hypothetical protein